MKHRILSVTVIRETQPTRISLDSGPKDFIFNPWSQLLCLTSHRCMLWIIGSRHLTVLQSRWIQVTAICDCAWSFVPVCRFRIYITATCRAFLRIIDFKSHWVNLLSTPVALSHISYAIDRPKQPRTKKHDQLLGKLLRPIRNPSTYYIRIVYYSHILLNCLRCPAVLVPLGN